MARPTVFAAFLVALTIPSVAAAQKPSLQVGLHGGFDFGEGEIRDERVGIQASVPVGWRLSVNPVIGYLYNFPDDPTGFFEGSASTLRRDVPDRFARAAISSGC